MNSDEYWSQFHKIEMIKANLLRLIDVTITMNPRNCIVCEHFDEATEVCNKYGNQRPPARIIASGCEGFENNDDIPF
ncbi:hypothetical protein AH03_57 [Erwinia phage AH03]|uniref:Uncharacterized protein n=1 Tax=Erwinia phage AH03 TaxID=2869568 RepID=A0AAE8BQS6_9CAUD|nr:hypothetical protein AH03_57 [Erwinia phage AH03]